MSVLRSVEDCGGYEDFSFAKIGEDCCLLKITFSMSRDRRSLHKVYSNVAQREVGFYPTPTDIFVLFLDQ